MTRRSPRKHSLPLCFVAMATVPGFPMVSSMAYAQSDTQSTSAPVAAAAPAEPAAAAPASVPAQSNTAASNSAENQGTAVFDTVNVNGSRSQAGIVDEFAARSRSTVTQRDLRRMVQGGALDALEGQPGISLNTNDMTGMSGMDFTVRGMSSDQVGITTDGVPTNDSGNYEVYPNQFGDPENIERISLTQGSSYSSSPNIGASGGSIEMRTISPDKKPGAFIKQTVGNHALRRSFVRLESGEHDGWSNWLSYSNTFSHKWRGKGDIKGYRVEGSSFYDEGNGNSTRLIAKYSEQDNYNYNTVSSEEFASDKKTDYPTKYTGPNHAYYGMNRNPFKTLNVTLDQELRLSNDVTASIRPYYYWGNGGSFSGYSGGQKLSSSTSSNGVYDLSNLKDGYYYRPSWTQTWRPGIYANLNWHFNEHHLINLGYWFERAKQVQTQPFIALKDNGNPVDDWGNPGRGSGVRDANGKKIQGRNQSTVTPSQKIWLRDRWYINDNWTVNAGIAYQHVVRRGQFNGSLYDSPESLRRSFSDWLPELNVAYNIDDANMVYANITRNVKTPPNYVLYDGGSSLNTKAEKSWNKEIGWRYQTTDLQLGVALYDIRYKNRIVSSQDTDGAYTLMNLGNVENKGIEFSYKQQLPWNLTDFASFTYNDSKQHNQIQTKGVDLPTVGKHLANSPTRLATVGFGYETPQFYTNISANYTSGFYGDQTNSEHIGSRTVFNLYGGVRIFKGHDVFKDTYLRFTVDNLFDRKYLSSARTIAFNSEKVGNVYGSTPYYNIGERRSFAVSLETSF